MKKKPLGLYIHIPYCIHKCGYCDFNSHPIKRDEMDHYIDALVLEMKHYAKIYTNTNIIKTIFLGGGTPTTLNAFQLDRILKECVNEFTVASDAEVTIEANPATVDVNLMKSIRRTGYNRISIGVQSFDKEELKLLKAMPENAGLDSVIAQANDLETSIEKLQEESAGFSGIIEASRVNLSNCSDDLDLARSKLQACEGKRISFEALQQAALGQDNIEISAWLESHSLDSRDSLGESLDIQLGWELAVEAVLGDSLQAICVDGLSEVEELLKDLPRGTLSFVDSERVTVERANEGGFLAPLVTKVNNGWRIEDKLTGIFAADKLEADIAGRSSLASGESIITADGVWLGSNWIQVKSKSAQDSISKRKTMIEELS